jgi:integrase
VASIRDDRARLRLHVVPTLGYLLLADLRPHHVRDLLRDLRAKPSPKGGVLAPRTIRHVYFLLRQACHEAVVDELIAANPVQVKKGDLPGKEDKDPLWRAEADFTADEVEALISDPRIPEDRRVAYALEFLTGMRTGEVSARRWRDLDSDVKPLARMVVLTAYNSRLRVEKGTKTRVAKWIPIHPTLAKVLATWRLSGYQRMLRRKAKPDDLIVPGREGGFRNDGWALKCSHGDLAALGLRKRRHYDSRATFISLAEGHGARDDMVRWITHPSPRSAMDGYKRLSLLWPAMCEAVQCVPVELREGKVVALPGQARGELGETDEAPEGKSSVLG